MPPYEESLNGRKEVDEAVALEVKNSTRVKQTLVHILTFSLTNRMP